MSAERRLVVTGRIDGARGRVAIRLKGYPTPAGPSPYIGLVATKPNGMSEAMADIVSALDNWAVNPW